MATRQLNMFDAQRSRDPLPGRAPPHNRTETSRAAARAIEPQAGTKRAKVLAYVRIKGLCGATREEIAAGCRMPIQTVCGRVKELLDAGLLRESDTKRTTVAGVAAKVVVATLGF